MPGSLLRFETFTISEEGQNYVARDQCGADDDGILEIQSDSLDTLMIAMKAVIEHGLQPYVPNKPAAMPKWYEPYALHGDCTRVVLPSRDLKALFEMTDRAIVGGGGKVVSALAGASFAAAVWAVLSLSTHPLLIAIGESHFHTF